MTMKFIVAVFGVVCLAALVAGDDGCWRTTYGRGVGKVITTCSDDEEKNGALCYPKCKEGYYGVGPVCWQTCSEGFTDIGVGCQKPSAYGRSAGYISEDSCDGHSSTGCEKWGLLWYPKCKENFHNVGCCVCSPDCAPGFTDSGVDCTKDSYGRGAGKPLQCAPGLVEDAALCYKPCASDYNGDGPACWHTCPEGLTPCGGLCLSSTKECIKEIFKVAEDVAETAYAIATEPSNALDALTKALIKIATDLKYPICKNIS